ncbi:MAG: methyltransferase family protein [Candidatus Hodarchaeota archaeon]
MGASKAEQVREEKGPLLSWRMIPVVVFIFVVGIPFATWWVGKWVDTVLGLPVFPLFPLNLVVGAVLILCGVLLGWGSIYQLYRGGQGLPWGDVDGAAQSTELVTTGLYEYTRNPMILGFLLLLSGIGWVVQSITALLFIPMIVFVLLWVWLKLREEPRLEQRFGEAYRIYKETTPLIIPRPWRRTKKAQGNRD